MKKAFIEKLLNNKYSKLEVDSLHVKVTYKPNFLKAAPVIQTIDFTALKSICENVAKQNNFHHKINWNKDYLEVFAEVEKELI